MKVALSTFIISQNDVRDNVDNIINRIKQICKETEVDIIVFPEDCFTCLNISDDPEQDVKLGRSIDSEEINRIKQVASEIGVFVCFGFLELSKGKLFDSYAIIDDMGSIAFVHRRIHDGWFGPEDDRSIYGLGEKLEKVETKHGSFVILICGEITDNDLLKEAKKLNADYLLFPLLRACDEFSKEWLIEEMDYYKSQINKTNTLAFMINGLCNKGSYFGGAWVISSQGNILKEMITQREGYLIWDMKTPNGVEK